MIKCIIDGREGYPSTTEKIKVTYANPYVEDSGTYTYNIVFPMSIHANQVLFGNIHRFDVKKRRDGFENCLLYVDNKLFIKGKGLVTSVSETTVKLQIVGGKSRVKYNSNFDSHYIDKIKYPTVYINRGLDASVYKMCVGGNAIPADFPLNSLLLFIDLTKSNFVGEHGVAAFNPINNETYGGTMNAISIRRTNYIAVSGKRYNINRETEVMHTLAVQPYLLYVLKMVLINEGYKVVKNDFDREPWNRLLIASANYSTKIADALPHWTVYTFLEEVRKFLNASFVFDEVKKTVSILSTDELTSHDAVAYEPLDEYTVEYDEDGLANLATSNIEYSFADSPNREWREYMSQEVLQNYTIKECASSAERDKVAAAMKTSERRTTIFKVKETFYIYALMPVNDDPENTDKVEKCVMCGFFNPAIREMDSDNSVSLRIAPVAFYQRKRRERDKDGVDKLPNNYICIPSAPCVKGVPQKTVDEDGEAYVSVQDAMMGEDIKKDEEDDSSVMSVMFQGVNVVNILLGQSFPYTSSPSGENSLARYPVTLTDCRMFGQWVGAGDSASLSLDNLPHLAQRDAEGNWITFGTATANKKKVDIDKNNLFCIRFLTDEVPDPSRIYIFNNRRFICKKIECEVSGDGVDKLKVGYFYELL